MPPELAHHDVLRAGAYELEVLCPFTRPWAVDPFFDALEASDVPLERASFTAYVDSDDGGLVAAVRRRLEALPCSDLRIHVSGWRPPQEYEQRRLRHAAMRLATQGLVGTGPLLLLEDDTLVPPATFEPLRRLRARWAIGVQVGRWAQRCIGLWHVDGRHARTLMPEEADCNATGFYCVLTTGAVYRSLDMWRWDNSRGHDVSATLGLEGIAVAWDVRTGHLIGAGVISCEEAVRYETQWPAPEPVNAAIVPAPEDGVSGRLERDGQALRAATRIYGRDEAGRRCLLYCAGAIVPLAEAERLGLPVL